MLARHFLGTQARLEGISVRITKPQSLLYARAGGVELHVDRANLDDVEPGQRASYFIEDLTVRVIVGVNQWEREEKQDLRLQLVLRPSTASPSLDALLRTVTDRVDRSAFLTVETLAGDVADCVLSACHATWVRVRVEKPSALATGRYAGIEITRQRAQSVAALTDLSLHTVYLGLGSNLGHRSGNLHKVWGPTLNWGSVS